MLSVLVQTFSLFELRNTLRWKNREGSSQGKVHTHTHTNTHHSHAYVTLYTTPRGLQSP